MITVRLERAMGVVAHHLLITRCSRPPGNKALSEIACQIWNNLSATMSDLPRAMAGTSELGVLPSHVFVKVDMSGAIQLGLNQAGLIADRVQPDSISLALERLLAAVPLLNGSMVPDHASQAH